MSNYTLVLSGKDFGHSSCLGHILPLINVGNWQVTI